MTPEKPVPALIPENTSRCFGDRLRRSRERSTFPTQEALARAIGVNRVLISNFESGRKAPDPEQAVQIAAKLGEDAQEFLLLALIQKSAREEKPNPFLLKTLGDLLAEQRGGTRSPTTRSPRLGSHLSLLDFPDHFTPMTVVVGDKREDEPKNAGDLYLFSASTVDDRWLLSLGLPRDTEKISDKVLMTAMEDERWLRRRFGRTHLLIVGSPASNLFARKYNMGFFFRFAISRETETKWKEKEDKMRALRNPAELAGFRELSKPDLKQTMRLFKQPGFVNFLYENLKLGIDPAENRDFAVVSLGRNPYAEEGEPFFAILAAGVHHPGTAHAVRFLSTQQDPDRFKDHPFGGVIEVQVPSDNFPQEKVRWHNKIEESRAEWHRVGTSRLEYTPQSFLEDLERWIEQLKARKVVTDVELTVDELEQHKKLVEQLKRPAPNGEPQG